MTVHDFQCCGLKCFRLISERCCNPALDGSIVNCEISRLNETKEQLGMCGCNLWRYKNPLAEVKGIVPTANQTQLPNWVISWLCERLLLNRFSQFGAEPVVKTKTKSKIYAPRRNEFEIQDFIALCSQFLSLENEQLSCKEVVRD